MVHDRGLAWKDDTTIKRGEELVLWGALDAANYNYLMEWTFRDDGVLLGRVAATGPNLPYSEEVTHIHSPTWRLDIDLDGFPRDSVYEGRHAELPGNVGDDTGSLVAQEKGLDWSALAFTSLHVHDEDLKNAKGRPSAYHLMPLRFGTARHDEPFTRHDFWVTRYRPLDTVVNQLPGYVEPPEPVASADVVVWYTGSIHHIARQEDGEFVGCSGPQCWSGAAHAMWVGFMLKPHDVFDRTPFFP